MKKFILAILTVAILVGINSIVARKCNLTFLDASLPVGVTLSLLLGFFSSTGGPLSHITEGRLKFLVEKDSRAGERPINFYVSTPLIVCVCCTIISAICVVVTYWEYF